MKLIATLILFLSFGAHAQVITQQNILQGVVPLNLDDIPMNTFILDRIGYDDNIYSTSRKTELGDNTRLSMAMRYHVAPMTFARVRFVTQPVENRINNKTSRFELIFARQFENFNVQIDLDLLTNDTEDDPDSGGTSLGPDLDSDDTFISYMIDNNHSIVFYPFNFRSDVGDEFNSLDVSRIQTLANGSPSSIGASPIDNEVIVSKTIPGLEYNYSTGIHNFYVGLGVASYIFPTNDDFDIETNPSSSAWERNETTAYKFGYLMIDSDETKVNFQHLAHDKTQETGSLLASATSLNIFKRKEKFIFEYESTMSVAGDAPYDIDPNTRWFRNNTTPFIALYADVNGKKQDWIGESGYGHSLKFGYNIGKITPYLSLKYLDEHFIYDGIDSAHLLRNADETLSHGGLTKIGVGAYFYKKNMFFRPYLEYQKAENPVFTNSTDIRDDRAVSSFRKENYLLSFNFTYTFDNFSSNQLWWF